MKCVICRHGETREGRVTVTLHRGETVMIIRDVSASTCGLTLCKLLQILQILLTTVIKRSS